MTDRRDRLLGYGPQGLALEFNPWQTKEAVEQALLYRGAIVAGWANVEASLIEVAIRASHHASYIGYRPTYPSKLKSRIAYLGQILELDGPLKRYARLGRSVLDRYAATENLRNLMAHGRMDVLPDWGVTIHFFQPVSGDEIRYQRQRYLQRDLLDLAQKAARFSRAVRLLVHRLDTESILPPLSVAE